MRVLHTFWQPESNDAFVQNGDFFLWVETAKTLPQSASHQHQHPRHLPLKDLHGLLDGLKFATRPNAFLAVPLPLPSDGASPLPCPELAVFGGIDYPEQAEIRPWTVCAFRLAEQPLGSLNELHFQTLFQGQEIAPGSDFLFWYWFSQSLKSLMCKDAFVPTLKLKAAEEDGYELYAGFEFAAEAYGKLIEDAAARMPQSAAPGFEPESLLRHCAEVLLRRCVVQTNPAQALQKKLPGSLLDAALNLGGVRWQEMPT